MTPERWTRLTQLFDAALDRQPADRAAFLARACPGDEDLRQEVERLIEAYEQAGDLGATPAFRVAAATLSPDPAAADVSGTVAPGARLGRYEVIALVGSGGMGDVYRARDPQLGREVAIKVLRQRGEISAEQLKRFEREARAAGALSHPNILAVHDIGLAGGVPFVVSELLEGQTLRALLASGRMPVDRAIAIARQIATGLAAAHDKGIVHRDLKPDNLFVTTEDVVKILDFGLAKQTAPFLSGARNGSALTDRGFVVGTAGYMSPEQVRGHDADARADVFAFGAVLCEMVTGDRAFTGDSAVETMNAILTSEPRALSRVPAPLVPTVRRCLEKEPDRRFSSMRELGAAIDAAEAELGVACCLPGGECDEPPARSRRAAFVRGPWLWAAAPFAAAIALGVMVSGRATPPAPGASGRPAIAVMPVEDHSGDPSLAWLSDGLSSMLVTALAQTPGLDVIGTERLDASFRELGRQPSDRSARFDVARRAGAGAVLVASVFKVGSELRLEVQVQAVDTGRVVAARSEQGTDLFAAVDATARHVRAALDVASRPAGRPLRDVTTASLEAYQLYAKAQQARHNNRMADARTLIEEALRIDPAFTLARAQLVTILARLGELAASEEARRIVLAELHRLPDRQRLLAEAVQEYDANPPRALELLERLLERYPDEEEAYDAIVHAYTHTRDPLYMKKALGFMQRWARAIPGPGSGHFHNHFGYAYIEHGLYTEAEREFRAYIRVSPDEANGYDSLAELFLMTGRPALAIEQYDRALRLNPSFSWSHFGRAYAFGMQGRYDEALAAMTMLHDLGPRSDVPAAVVNLFDVLLYSRLGRYDDASRHVEAAREFARKAGDNGAVADADLFDAVLALERGQHARAVEFADRAARAGGQTANDIMRARRTALAHLLAGVAESRAGRHDAARGRLAVQRALDPGGDALQGSWRQVLAAEIALSEGRFDEAEKGFLAGEYRIDSSFAIFPALVALVNNLPFRDGIARTRLARGDAAGAIAAYRRLNQPSISATWTALFDPRFAAAAARLESRRGGA